MDKVSSLNLSFDRVVLQLVVPGLIASFPFFILFHNHFQNEYAYLETNDTLLVTTMTFIALLAGFTAENIGSHIEVLFYDPKHRKKMPGYWETWEKFLSLSYGDHEPVGHRYLRNVLMRMKVELSVGVAVWPMSIGLAILD